MNQLLELNKYVQTGASIYLDDGRQAPDGFIRTKSVNETIELIELLEANHININLLDLDHDLGEFAGDGGDAIKLLDYLVEHEKFYPIKLHTFNWVARDNMQRMLDRFWPKENH